MSDEKHKAREMIDAEVGKNFDTGKVVRPNLDGEFNRKIDLRTVLSDNDVTVYMSWNGASESNTPQDEAVEQIMGHAESYYDLGSMDKLEVWAGRANPDLSLYGNDAWEIITSDDPMEELNSYVPGARQPDRLEFTSYSERGNFGWNFQSSGDDSLMLVRNHPYGEDQADLYLSTVTDDYDSQDVAELARRLGRHT